MPRILLSLPETVQSITRPIVTDIAREIFDATGIDQNTQIFYPGDIDKIKQPGSSISDPGPGINLYPFSERVSIVVEEDYETDRLLSTAIYRPENFFIFRDDPLETYVKPVYSSTDTKINFIYRTADKVRAVRWRDNLRNRISMMHGAEINLHEITYNYIIPPEYLYVLREIHRLRENVAGYGDSFDDYFRNNLTPKATVITTTTGTQGTWAIPETQLRIVGYYDFEGGPPLEEREETGGVTYTISFAYKFKYDKAIACTMFYPLMIHNQVLSTKYRPNKPAYELDQQLKVYSLSAKYFHGFEKGKTKLDTLPGVAIPSYDEFIPEFVLPETKRLFTALVSIDVNSPLELMSLNNMTSYKLNPLLAEFLAGEAQYMTIPGASVFTLSLYRGQTLMDANSVSIDSNLNITSTTQLAFRDYHHVRIGVMTNLTKLATVASDRLRANCKLFRMVMEYIDPSIVKSGLLPSCGSTVTQPRLSELGKVTSYRYPSKPVVNNTTVTTNGTEVPINVYNDAVNYINRIRLSEGNQQYVNPSVYTNLETLVIRVHEHES
jgi:hypothetical protein